MFAANDFSYFSLPRDTALAEYTSVHTHIHALSAAARYKLMRAAWCRRVTDIDGVFQTRDVDMTETESGRRARGRSYTLHLPPINSVILATDTHRSLLMRISRRAN